MKFIYIFILTTLTLALSAFGQATAKGSKDYLSQAYVDTTVMRAIYVLNEASASYSVNATTQNVAVTRARSILNDLRTAAKGDPNELYALMKIHEVEAQIYLEEEEMRKIAADKRVLEANKIVLQYNAEVGKMRPDFAKLRGLFRRMAEVDTRQANNLANSYNKRYRQISREAQLSLEKALTANDVDLAKRELEYCERNKFHLMLSSSLLERQRKRYEKIAGAKSEIPKVVNALDAGETAYRASNLSASRTNLTMARNRINEFKPYISAAEGAALSGRCDRLMKALDAREDSLVRAAIYVLNMSGPDAAVRYLQDELHQKHKLSAERASIVDKAIINKTSAAAGSTSSVNMVETANLTDPNVNYAILLDIEAKARYRAQEKADSLQRVRERANTVSINIYTLLEQNKGRDAMRLYNKEKTFLAKTLERSAYDMLSMSVNAPRTGRHVNTAGGRQYVGIINTSPGQQHGDMDKNREKAKDVERRLYALIEKNEIADAYLRFQERKKPLQKYLDRDSYEMLEFTVVQSYHYISKK